MAQALDITERREFLGGHQTVEEETIQFRELGEIFRVAELGHATALVILI